MPTTPHGKYPPPPVLEAPPELARLVAAHLACEPGREWGRTLLRIYEYGVRHRVRINQTYFIGESYVSLSDSLAKVCRRGESNNGEEQWR